MTIESLSRIHAHTEAIRRLLEDVRWALSQNRTTSAEHWAIEMVEETAQLNRMAVTLVETITNAIENRS